MTPAVRQAVVLAGLCAEAKAVVNAFTTAPTAARKAQINAAIKALKAADLWSKIDSLYVLAAADSQAARVDWKRPSVTASVANSPTFTADRGYTFDGSTNYLDLNFTPSTQGVNMTSAGGTWGVWELTSLGSNTYHGGQGTAGANARTLVCPRNSTSAHNGAVASALVTGIGSSITTSIGLTTITGNGTAIAAHKNGAASGTGTAGAASASLNRSLWIGGYNAGSLTTPRATQCAMTIAANFTTDAQHLAFYNAMLPYVQAVGAA